MNVVLVLPPYDYCRSVGSRRKRVQIGLLPPLGAGYLASSLRAAGHTAVLVDAVAEQLDVPQTADAVFAAAPDLIGISSFTTMRPNDAYALARELKRRRPEIPIVMGGPHVTSFARTILDECAEVDYLVPGDGEMVLAELAGRLRDKQPLDGMRGILYRGGDGTLVAAPPAEVITDIDRFPHPERGIYKAGLYEPLPSLSNRRPVTSIITARGCPWARCRFCYQGGEYAAPYRRRSPENVVDEIRDLVRRDGVRNLVFWDDNFCCMPEWVETFCGLLERERFDLVWSVLSRVDTITPEMLARMARAGCYSIQFGIESGSQPILNLIRKGHTLEQCRRAVRWAKQAGMDTRAFFILGFPSETREMAEQTLRFAQELNLDYVVFFPYHIQPGTDLAAFAVEHGTLGEFTGMQPPSYTPDTYASPEELAHLLRNAYRRYYLRPRYIARALARTVRRPSLIVNHVQGFAHWVGLMKG